MLALSLRGRSGDTVLSYMLWVILKTSIISPRKRLYFRVGSYGPAVTLQLGVRLQIHTEVWCMLVCVLILVVWQMIPAVYQWVQSYICYHVKQYFTSALSSRQSFCSSPSVLSANDFITFCRTSSSGGLGYVNDGRRGIHQYQVTRSLPVLRCIIRPHCNM